MRTRPSPERAACDPAMFDDPRESHASIKLFQWSTAATGYTSLEEPWEYVVERVSPSRESDTVVNPPLYPLPKMRGPIRTQASSIELHRNTSTCPRSGTVSSVSATPTATVPPSPDTHARVVAVSKAPPGMASPIRSHRREERSHRYTVAKPAPDATTRRAPSSDSDTVSPKRSPLLIPRRSCPIWVQTPSRHSYTRTSPAAVWFSAESSSLTADIATREPSKDSETSCPI